ncbi:MAG: diacylglycerol kinase family lipid kinase [Myxococcota bacterium]|nr:diacylglycerol kinase family lipid kinase [Myxococcota bacterium]
MIVNPTSGRQLGEAVHADVIERLRPRWPALEAVLTPTCGEAEAAARSAALEGVRTIFALGGDGTLNAVVNGIGHVPGALAQTTFGVLPGGTGNDFAGTLGLNTSIEEAADLLRRGEARTVDLGVLEDRIFTNVSAGGLFAEASEAASAEAKSTAGRLAYILAGPRLLLDHEGFEVELRATTPEGPLTWRGSVAMFAVCNAPTAGGGRPLAPFARCDDGWLDAFVVEEASPLGLARVLIEISGGNHLEDDRVVGFRTSELFLRFDRPTLVNVDGEVSTLESAHYRVLRRATRMLVAPGAFDTGI